MAKEIPAWYFGKVTKDVAHERLAGTMSGTFLVRDNETSRGSYVISMNDNGMVVDYDIRKTGRTLKIRDRDFADLDALIGYYQKYPLDTITLDTPCSKEGMPSPPISPSWHK
ncbi:crk-like protein [Patiria miniata]|uniref:SH2 domain-containing protein n=1 Tax=Patiria miniata TaxID=46514 RepID=A0A913ZLJ1_PATMI|nr:crk-like protein [Patiria miniata]